ncbi:unnamed protein product [Moneuplotes crassus]|uniref:Uncharacterized protein n=1 Tax=Euplotes crassus TaxID=5936 RepID=A0AAD1X9V5_EUPCR|nr:unnamed protein product [Moneuplotes crassus]
MNKFNKFSELTCQLTHCEDKAKYFIPSFSNYVCGGCRQTKFFDEKVIILSDPEEVLRALQYVEYNIQSVDVCMMQEPKLKAKWRVLLESLEEFKHRYGQSKVAFDNLVKDQQWAKLSKILNELNSIQTDWKASKIFNEFLHYERQESIRLKCKNVVMESLPMQEKVALKEQVDALQREKIGLQHNYTTRIDELTALNNDITAERDQLARTLEASNAEVTDLKNNNRELEASLENCQNEKAIHLDQYEALKDRYEELKESADLMPRLRLAQDIAAETLQNPEFKKYLDDMFESKTFTCSLGEESDAKMFSFLTKTPSQILEKVEFWSIGRVNQASGNSFLRTCIPSSLETLHLSFYDGASSTPLTPYLASVLALKNRVTAKLILGNVKIKQSEQEQINQTFSYLQVEYSESAEILED